MKTQLIDTSSVLYLRRMVKELNALNGAGGFYVHANGSVHRMFRAKLHAERLYGREHGRRTWYDITPAVTDIDDCNGRNVCASRHPLGS